MQNLTASAGSQKAATNASLQGTACISKSSEALQQVDQFPARSHCKNRDKLVDSAGRACEIVPLSSDLVAIVFEDAGAHELIMPSDGCVCNIRIPFP